MLEAARLEVRMARAVQGALLRGAGSARMAALPATFPPVATIAPSTLRSLHSSAPCAAPIAPAAAASVPRATAPRLAGVAPSRLQRVVRTLMSSAVRVALGRPTSEDMRRLEAAANMELGNPSVQYVYNTALIQYGMPEEVMRRVESGHFSIDGAVVQSYGTAAAQALRLPQGTDRALHAALREVLDAGRGSAAPAALRGVVSRFAGGGAGGLAGAGTYGTTGFGGAGAGGASAAGSGGGGSGGSVAGFFSGWGSSSSGTRTNPLFVEVAPPKPSWLATVWRLFTIFLTLYIVYTIMSRSMPGTLAQLTGEDSVEEVTEIPTTRFTDVKGVDEAKQELQDVVAFLRDPDRFRRLGAKVPRGVLLTGPPGTGKTLLARAVAGEAGCKFYSKSASEFEEMLVGLGARRVRDLFNAAKKNAPAIIFIDEIDAMGGKRRVSIGGGAERQTLNQMLASMDGFAKNENVIVIAATNTPDILDPALIRPGRFDTMVNVPLPDVKGRREIIDLYLRKVVVSGDVDSELLAKATPGFSGAQIEAMINSAALMAANRGAEHIEMEDMEEARDKIWMGPARKSKVQEEAKLRMTAYHEGGHTLAALYTRGANPLHKVTILPRGQAGGVTFSLPTDEDYYTKENLVARIDVAMGGRAAEELLYGAEKVTTGAGSDMEQATNTARAMVARLSMSPLGLTTYGDKEASSEKQAQIDAEVEKMLQESYKRVYGLLSSRRAELDRLAAALLEYETLSAEEVRDVIAGKLLPQTRAKTLTLRSAARDKSAAATAAAGGAGVSSSASAKPNSGKATPPRTPSTPGAGGDGSGGGSGSGDAAGAPPGRKGRLSNVWSRDAVAGEGDGAGASDATRRLV